MTPAEAEAIGRAWIAAGGGWRAGMLGWYGQHNGRVVGQGKFPPEWRCETGYGFIAGWPESAEIMGGWPDFRDPATRGAALDVVRERWMDPYAHLFFANGEWCLRVLPWGAVLEPFSHRRLRDFRAPTEAAALLAALVAAPGVKS